MTNIVIQLWYDSLRLGSRQGNYIVKNIKVGSRILLFIGLAAVRVVHAQGPVVINFEGLPLTNGHLLITDQYLNKGIAFSNTTATSNTVPVGFRHSGSAHADSCFGLEFCTAPIVMTFTSPQKRVKVWVGYPVQGKFGIYLQCYTKGPFKKQDPNLKKTIQVTEPYILNLRPGSGLSGYQMFPIEVVVNANSIIRAELGFVLGAPNIPPLSIDDVEFERGQ